MCFNRCVTVYWRLLTVTVDVYWRLLTVTDGCWRLVKLFVMISLATLWLGNSRIKFTAFNIYVKICDLHLGTIYSSWAPQIIDFASKNHRFWDQNGGQEGTLRFRSCRGLADRSPEGPRAHFFLIFRWFLESCLKCWFFERWFFIWKSTIFWKVMFYLGESITFEGQGAI